MDRLYVGTNILYGHQKVDHVHKAETEIKQMGIGLNIGYQKKWERLTYDIGANLTKYIKTDGPEFIEYKDGTLQSFESDIDGIRPEVYLGISFFFDWRISNQIRNL